MIRDCKDRPSFLQHQRPVARLRLVRDGDAQRRYAFGKLGAAMLAALGLAALAWWLS